MYILHYQGESDEFFPNLVLTGRLVEKGSKKQAIAGKSPFLCSPVTVANDCATDLVLLSK